MSNKSLHIALTIDSNKLEDDIKILMKDVRPNWNHDKLNIKRFTEGLTNELYGVSEVEENDVVLVRIYGEKTELIIDRTKERMTMQILNQHGCAKPIYCTFENGICYGFQEGHVVGEAEMREETSAKLIATELARLHTLPIPKEVYTTNRSCQWVSFDTMLNLLPKDLTDPEKNKIYQEQFPSFAQLKAAVQELETIAQGFQEKLVLCHHDLMNRNIVISPNGNRAFFIDYEYAGPSYASLDIAGHFLSYVGIDNPNFDLYPSEEHRAFFLKCYLTDRKRFEGKKEEVTDEEVGLLNIKVHKMELMVLIYWSVWCALQQVLSKIDYPYLEGAIMMMGAYEMYKEQFLAL